MPRVAKDKAKRTKKKLNKTEQENTKTNTKDDKFSFDEEIVIGLKRIDEPKSSDSFWWTAATCCRCKNYFKAM